MKAWRCRADRPRRVRIQRVQQAAQLVHKLVHRRVLGADWLGVVGWGVPPRFAPQAAVMRPGKGKRPPNAYRTYTIQLVGVIQTPGFQCPRLDRLIAKAMRLDTVDDIGHLVVPQATRGEQVGVRNRRQPDDGLCAARRRQRPHARAHRGAARPIAPPSHRRPRRRRSVLPNASHAAHGRNHGQRRRPRTRPALRFRSDRGLGSWESGEWRVARGRQWVRICSEPRDRQK